MHDAATTWQVLTAPGVRTVVAVDGAEVVGFAQVQSDGLIQAHLSLLVWRSVGDGRALAGR